MSTTESNESKSAAAVPSGDDVGAAAAAVETTEAPTATTTTTTTAAEPVASTSDDGDASSVAAVIEKTTSDPRFVRGQTLLKEKRLEEAVVVYEDLLRTMIEAENQSDSLSVAPVYYQYGHSMLLLAEATASVFGGSVARPEDGDADAEQDAANTAEDLEVAWEMLEVARVIYSRYPGELAAEKELARVYMRLGDLGMESDVFDQARADYEKALALRQKVLAQTRDPDTTLLADLYCCLAISCIYQEAGKPESDGQDGDDTTSTSRQDDIRRREREGLRYYVLAGRVMADNIHRVAAASRAALRAFVAARVPKPPAADDEAPAGKGKRKLQPEALELPLLGGGADSLRDAFLAAASVGAAAAATPESLGGDEAQLLEYLEIYAELKEKVDGILESAAVESGDGKSEESKDEDAGGAVTTVGFGASASASGGASAVNVVAVKKRKVATATATASESSAVKQEGDEDKAAQ